VREAGERQPCATSGWGCWAGLVFLLMVVVLAL
jgi:hypothetical protein